MNELLERIEALAAAALPLPVTDHSIQPLRSPEGGFVDLQFDVSGCLVQMLDARGNLIEIGNRFETDDGFTIRIPWPVLPDPTVPMRGRSRSRRDTENMAAKMQLPRSGTARGAVLSAFIADKRDGGDGMIDEDVASRLQMNLYTVAPRRTELTNSGWLRPSGRYGRTKMNSDSIKWELTPAAIERLGLA